MRRAASGLLLAMACALGLCGCSAYDNIGANMLNDPAFDRTPSKLQSSGSRSSSSPGQ